MNCGHPIPEPEPETAVLSAPTPADEPETTASSAVADPFDGTATSDGPTVGKTAEPSDERPAEPDGEPSGEQSDEPDGQASVEPEGEADATAMPPSIAPEPPARVIPLEQVADMGTGDGGPARSGGAAATRRSPVAMIVTVVAALVAIAVCVGAFVTYRMELWGPQTVPSIEASAASDVIDQLEAKGFVVRKKQQYSGVRKGGYIGMEGARSGERLAKGSEVTVMESLGPGVPEGTVGSSVDEAEKSLKSMGVKITEHEVVSDNPGKVTVTMPEDGQPVTDEQDGIHLGVGIEGDGIPVEIAGMDKDEAKRTLTGKGYTVTLEPRFSSREYLGKITGADPGIGVRTDETDVTLYYGVDASGRYDVLTTTYENDPYGFADAGHADRLVGRYCTEDGDCLSLKEVIRYGLTIDGNTDGNWNDSLSLCPYAQAPGACTPTNLATDGGSMSKDMAYALLSGDTGAFEVYSGRGLANCGSDVQPVAPGSRCDHGHLVSGENESAGESTGLTYDAKEFLVYMPVDADLFQLEQDGYFDGASDYTPDADRPYFIRRNNDAYQTVGVDPDATSPQYDPYTPTRAGKPVAFRDAPNKDNVYYLVETPIEWNRIDGIVTDDDEDETAPDSASAAVFEQFAGDYMFLSGGGGWATTLTLAADGSFSGEYHDSDMGTTGPDYPNGELQEAVFSGRFSSASKNDDGTYTLQCDADRLTVQGEKGDSFIRDDTLVTIADVYGMEPCGSFTAYPKGYDSAKLSDDVKMWNAGSYDFTTDAPLTVDILTNDHQQESFYSQKRQ